MIEEQKFNKAYCQRKQIKIAKEIDKVQFEFIQNKILKLFNSKKIDVTNDKLLVNSVETERTDNNEVNNFLTYVYGYFSGKKLDEFVDSLKSTSLELTEHEEEFCFNDTKGFYYDNCDITNFGNNFETRTRYVIYKTLSGETRKVKDILTRRVPDNRVILEKNNDFIDNPAYFKQFKDLKKQKKSSKLDKVLV